MFEVHNTDYLTIILVILEPLQYSFFGYRFQAPSSCDRAALSSTTRLGEKLEANTKAQTMKPQAQASQSPSHRKQGGNTWLKIHQNRAGDVASAGCLVEVHLGSSQAVGTGRVGGQGGLR